MVMEADIAYEDFAASDLMGLSLNTDNRLAMGASWRGGGGPNQAPSMLDDRYFIVRDAQGNHYKLRWVSLTRNGERGRPSFEYTLVQAAE
nr:HmuY family protein [Nitritalea halalkaliphila]